MPENSQPLRIALLGIYHESNTFIEKMTTLDDFRKGHWLKGDSIFQEYRGSFHEIGGMLDEIGKHPHVELVPVMYAEATPGGIISRETYAVLLNQMMEDLSQILPVDGCLVVPHGAGVSEAFRDMDGHWLSLLRQKLGSSVPIMGTNDPHANVSEAMVAATNALVAYQTNPHIDQRDAGRIAAAMLIETLEKRISPFQQLFQSPVSISIEQQHTASEPCLGLYRYADDFVSQRGVLHASINLGFPYADVNEMGTSFVVITDRNPALADHIGKSLVDYMINNKEKFVGEKKDIHSVLPLLRASEKPVLLLDMGDNIGGGAPGNSSFLLGVFETTKEFSTFICLFDPSAVERTRNVRPGDPLMIDINDEVSNTTFRVSGRLLKHVNGKFSESTPRHGGQVNYDMGTTAIVETINGNTLMIMSIRIPPFSLRQITSFGIDPGYFDVIVAKGVIAPIAAYSPVCKTIFQVDTPGKTRADMTLFPYRYRRKPLFPFEAIAG